MSEAKKQRQLLDKYIKEVRGGIPFADPFIEKSSDIFDNALLARNLTEDALAREVLKNTGVPIPGKGASRLEIEDFLNQIAKEQYPDLEPNIEVGGDSDYYQNKKIKVSDYNTKISPEKAVGTTLHEMGHQLDAEKFKDAGKELKLKSLRDAKQSGIDLKNKDSLQVYDEIVGKDHHLNLPERPKSYGFSNLLNAIKGKPLRALAPVALGIASGGASAAAELAGTEEVGESAEEEGMMLAEADARQNYKSSPAKMARLQALKNIKEN